MQRMSDKVVKLKSKDGCVETEVPEKYVAALLASGKYVLDDSVTERLPETQKTL